MKSGLLNLCICFLVSIIISPLIIKWLRKLKFGQSILVYVEQHKSKSGTPTMGGIIIIISALIGYLIFFGDNNILATISILSFVFFGLLGFLDDFIKIKFKQNEGLKPYQKVIGQLGLSIIIAIYIYMSELVGTKILLPFNWGEVDIGLWIIPFVVFFFIAVVNSVNLIDGLDGLCGGVSVVVLSVLSIILMLISKTFDGVYLSEINNIIIVTLGVVGAILGFLCFNSFPAKVFMGDTGSLAIGGFLSAVLALSKEYMLMLIIGFAFVLTVVSVVIQVSVYKLTKKRVFKMSPMHHHFESMMHEAKVTNLYMILTLIIGVLTISFYL